MTNILILGGTTEARELAAILAARGDCNVMLSLAGRTRSPIAQPVPVRVGGFGGVDGLASYLRKNSIGLLIDATHPYAARISANAVGAVRLVDVPMIALRRPGWLRSVGDRWLEVDTVEEAARALGNAARNVFLALGRQELLPFESYPQHRYLIRSVDPVEPPLTVPNAQYILARGPFDEADEAAMLTAHSIAAIVCKNSGGTAAYGKIVAARKLGIEVVLIRRPVLPKVPAGETVAQVAEMVRHQLAAFAERGE